MQTKVGEFVYYETLVDGEPRWILGKIIHRRLVRGLPDAFLADAGIAPRALAELIGLQAPEPQLFEVVVSITGYFDRTMRDFITNPRIPPAPGIPIRLVPSDLLKDVLSPLAQHSRGSAHLGSLLSRSAGEVPIVIDVKNMVSTHLAILASTGSGKSYTAGVLVEELLRPYNRAAVLVIDPHGEYHTLKETLEGHPDFCEGSRPRVAIFNKSKVKVRTSTLKLGDLYHLLPELSDKMRYYLQKAYRQVQDTMKRIGREHTWGVADLLNAVDDLQDGRGDGSTDDTGEYPSVTACSGA